MYPQHLHCNVKNDESDLKKCMTRNQLHVHLCNKYSYFIHTEIYTVRYYPSWLWLDKRCTFGVVHFLLHSINLAMNKINASYHGKCLNNFYSLAATHQKTHSFAAFTRWVFFTALQLVNKNCSCTPSLDKYLRTLTCTNLNWVTWKVRIWERKKRNSLLYVQYINLIPPVTKTEFLLTISIQYQADK